MAALERSMRRVPVLSKLPLRSEHDIYGLAYTWGQLPWLLLLPSEAPG